MTASFTKYERCFNEGYDEDAINDILGHIQELTDTTIVCLWEFRDHLGYGGESELFLLDDGALYCLGGDLWPWLLDGTSEAPNGPGTPAQWKGHPTGQVAREFQGDGRHNLAWKNHD
jgi:hypothetical protein